MTREWNVALYIYGLYLHENINHRLISLNTWPPVGGNSRPSTTLGGRPWSFPGFFLCLRLADQDVSSQLFLPSWILNVSKANPINTSFSILHWRFVTAIESNYDNSSPGNWGLLVKHRTDRKHGGNVRT